MPRYKVQSIDDHGEPVHEPHFVTADTEKQAHATYCDEMNAQGKRAAPKVRITHALGKPGLGTCICPGSPESRYREAERQAKQSNADPLVLFGIGLNMKLDHRCPMHGEKAQPDLWGRHKDLELIVTPAQWLSLGVTFEG